MNKEIILWDWNGTLLDDADICLQGMNTLLKKRNIPALDMIRYREIFTFPVRDYYEAAGFDFSIEPFETPAEEYIVHYKRLLPLAGLFPDAREILGALRQKGYRQFILSAMEKNALLKSVKDLEVDEFFDDICGLEDNLAFSKAHLGHRLFEREGLDPQKTIMVGDTLHDAEVASQLGIDMVFISRGHQSLERLSHNGNQVFPDLTSFCKYLF
ncbi:MAG: HAD family hydrolase [Bacteroides sp.]|nr:HAD family hydrolase [Bacteroides sp.]